VVCLLSCEKEGHSALLCFALLCFAVMCCAVLDVAHTGYNWASWRLRCAVLAVPCCPVSHRVLGCPSVVVVRRVVAPNTGLSPLIKI
jgi:pheromone shutdown protein TraB